jgi:hypothetical protein
MKSKPYRYAKLRELVHSVSVEHASEHEVIYGSKSVWKKREEGETVIEWQPPRTLGREATTSSQG